jgi:hypothetical protein
MKRFSDAAGRVEAITAWRALDGWKQRFARIRELLDSFEVATLDVAAERG